MSTESPKTPDPPPARKRGKRGDNYTSALRLNACHSLLQLGWTRRDIARLIGIEPKAVRKYLAQSVEGWEAGTEDVDVPAQLAGLRERVVRELDRRLKIIEDQPAEELSGVSTLASLSGLLDKLERSMPGPEPEADTRPIAQRPSVFDKLLAEGKEG